MKYVNKASLNLINDSIVVSILTGRLFFGGFVVLINLMSVLVSWYFNKSILWAILHYQFGLLYLLYSTLMGRFANGGFMDIINSYF